MYRTNQLISLVLNEINPDFFIIRGDNLPSELISKIKKEGIELRLFDNKTTPDVLVDYIKTLDNHFIMGIGNIVGWGEEFVNILKGYKSDDS